MNREEIVEILTRNAEEIVKPYFDSREEIIKEVKQRETQKSIRLEQITLEKNSLRVGLDRLRTNKEEEINSYIRDINPASRNIRDRLEKEYEAREHEYERQFELLEEEQRLLNVNYSNLKYEKGLPGKKELALAHLGRLIKEIQNQIEIKETEMKIVDIDIQSIRNKFYSWEMEERINNKELVPYYTKQEEIKKQIKQLKELLEKVKEQQSIMFNDEELNNYLNGIIKINDNGMDHEKLETEPEKPKVGQEEPKTILDNNNIGIKDSKVSEKEEQNEVKALSTKEKEQNKINSPTNKKIKKYSKIKRDLELVPNYEKFTIKEIKTAETKLIEEYEEKLIEQIYDLLSQPPNKYVKYNLEIAKLKYENQIQLLNERIKFKEQQHISKFGYIKHVLELSALKYKLSNSQKKLLNLNEYILKNFDKQRDNSSLGKTYRELVRNQILLNRNDNNLRKIDQIREEKNDTNLFSIAKLEIKYSQALQKNEKLKEQQQQLLEKRERRANKMVLYRNGIVRGTQILIAYDITKTKIKDFIDKFKDESELNEDVQKSK